MVEENCETFVALHEGAQITGGTKVLGDLEKELVRKSERAEHGADASGVFQDDYTGSNHHRFEWARSKQARVERMLVKEEGLSLDSRDFRGSVLR